MSTTIATTPTAAPGLTDRDRDMMLAVETLSDESSVLMLRWLAAGPLSDAEIERRSGWDVIVRGCLITDLIGSGLVTAAGGRYSLDTERIADVAAFVSGLGHRTITLGEREP